MPMSKWVPDPMPDSINNYLDVSSRIPIFLLSGVAEIILAAVWCRHILVMVKITY